MAISEESRYHLYQRLEEVLGVEEAATLMKHLPPVGWADVATKRDLDALAVATKRDLDALGVATKHGIDDLKHDIGVLASVSVTRDQMADLRSQLERDLRSLTWRFITVLIAAMSIVLAGIKL
jgi:hypothetical protein